MKKNPRSKIHLPKIPLNTIDPPVKVLLNLNQDKSRFHPVTDKLVVDDKLRKTEKALQLKRSKLKGLEGRLRAQWFSLLKKERDFRDTVISHNTFLRGNLEKRSRAAARLEQQSRLIEERQLRIEKMSRKLSDLRYLHREMNYEIEQHKLYETYLLQLLEHPESPFTSINELLVKFESLENVRIERMMEQKAETTRVLETHKMMVELLRDRNVSIIGLRNFLSESRKRYEKVSRKNLSLEVLLQNIANHVQAIYVEVQTCRHMLKSMYETICVRRKMRLRSLDLADCGPKIDLLKRTMKIWEMGSNNPVLQKKKEKNSYEQKKE